MSHEDRRGYIGKVEEFQKNNSTRYFITEGFYYYGIDLKTALEPMSGGTFSLQEIVDDKEEEEYEDSEDFDDFAEGSWDEGDAFQ